MPSDSPSAFGHVIVGVDGRPAARDAIALARSLAGDGATLTLAHVHAGDLRPSHTSSPPFDTVARDESRLLLEAERSGAGVDAELQSVAATSVGRGLHELAASAGADLLVVGSCTRGPAGRVLLGNDTRASLSGAPCAVAVAPLHYATAAHALGSVGVGYDGSPESDTALAFARRFAAQRGASLRVLMVLQMPTSLFAGFAAEAWSDELEQILKDATERLRGLGGRRRRGRCRPARRGARRIRRARGPARDRLARLRPAAPADVRRHRGTPQRPLRGAAAGTGARRGRGLTAAAVLSPSGRRGLYGWASDGGAASSSQRPRMRHRGEFRDGNR